MMPLIKFHAKLLPRYVSIWLVRQWHKTATNGEVENERPQLFNRVGRFRQGAEMS